MSVCKVLHCALLTPNKSKARLRLDLKDIRQSGDRRASTLKSPVPEAEPPRPVASLQLHLLQKDLFNESYTYSQYNDATTD